MKRLVLVSLLCLLTTASAPAQGLVNFFNNPTTLVSYFGPGPNRPIPSGQPGTAFFALLIAPVGTTDPRAFYFSGVQGTNTAAAGRFNGGSGVSVAGWAAGTSRAFEVAGWTADLGPTFEASWLAGDFAGAGTSSSMFGLSMIGSGFAGGSLTDGARLPACGIFGQPPAISTGFVLLSPEPSAAALIAVGIAVSAWWRRWHGHRE